MIVMQMEVVFEDGPQGPFPVTPKVQVEFERHFKTGIGKAFENDAKMEHIYWLAWKSMHYAGSVVKPFDEWLDKVQSINVINDGDRPLDVTA